MEYSIGLRDKATVLFNAGMTKVDISTELGPNRKTIETWLNDYDNSSHIIHREMTAQLNRELYDNRPKLKRYRSTANGKRVRAAAQVNRRHRLRAGGGGISRDEISSMWEGQRGLCKYCECKMLQDGDKNNPAYCTIDHVIPVSKGGEHIATNAVLACRRCNSMKSNKIISATI